MSLFESIIYGFISGIAEFFPVSSQAHQTLLRYILGASTRNSLQELLVHIGLLMALFFACRDLLSRLQREQKSISTSRLRKNRSLDVKSRYDLRLIKTATFPLILCLILYAVIGKRTDNLLTIMCFLIVNGLILLFAEHIQHGNRDSRTMTGLDGIIMGILGALSFFPGISRTGIISAYATTRGADNQNATNWAFLLGIPAIIFAACYDIVMIFIAGIGAFSFQIFIGCILSGIGAFAGSYIAIKMLTSVLNHTGYSPFIYYSFGAALFSFALYLIT